MTQAQQQQTYILCFDPSDNVFNHAIHNYIRDATAHILTWWHYIPGMYIFNSSRNLAQIQDDFIPMFSGRFFLVQAFKPQGAGGWLPQDAWKWLNAGGYPNTLTLATFTPKPTN